MRPVSGAAGSMATRYGDPPDRAVPCLTSDRHLDTVCGTHPGALPRRYNATNDALVTLEGQVAQAYIQLRTQDKREPQGAGLHGEPWWL